MPQLKLVFTLFAVLLCSTIRAEGMGKTVSPPVSKYFPDINGNLTKVTWAHAVNSRAELEEALTSTKMMLEADIIMGTLKTSDNTQQTPIPVMGHPPATESDISLEEFLTQVSDNATRGVKLDFKSIEVFEASKEILAKLRTNMTFPVWINADILPGPVNATENTPVDPIRFLTGAAETFPESTLSIGWTTRYGNTSSGNITEGSYSTDHVNAMLNIISTNNVTQPITYPVRAGLAAQSIDALQSLISRSTDGATITIWSSAGDNVDGDKLSELIRKIGVEKVYIDVPDSVWETLNISSGVSGRKIGAFAFSALLAAVAIVRLF